MRLGLLSGPYSFFVCLFELCLNPNPKQIKTYEVKKVINGNTMGLTNGIIVRLIGIGVLDNYMNDKVKEQSRWTGQPKEKIVKIGKMSTKFLRKLVEGKKVYLDYDTKKNDGYGRVLAYVLIEIKWYHFFIKRKNFVYDENGKLFVNATMIKSGFATSSVVSMSHSQASPERGMKESILSKVTVTEQSVCPYSKKGLNLIHYFRKGESILENQIIASVVPVHIDFDCAQDKTITDYLQILKSSSLSGRYASAKALPKVGFLVIQFVFLKR